MAMNSDAAKTAAGIFSSDRAGPAMMAPATTSVAAITAMPRALRRRNAMRRPRIRPCQRMPQQQRPDRPDDAGRKHRGGKEGKKRQGAIRKWSF